MQPLKLLSLTILEGLSRDVATHLDRYRTGDFEDLARENGWAIETSAVKWDPSVVANLDPSRTPEAEIKNSLLIFKALSGMTPAMARDERIWARMCHIECLTYTRARWLRAEQNPEPAIRKHFFAKGLTGCRDDNGIGRLWWNGHIASLACPDDIELGLKRLLARANIRLQVIERADTAFRKPLISGIVQLLNDPWFDSYDAAIADFMFEVNKRSGGIVFEAMNEDDVSAHLALCISAAKRRSSVSTAQ